MPAPTLLDPVWLVGFSGNRPRSGSPGRSAEEIEACAPHLAEALAELQQRAEKEGGHIELFTGLAEGADLVVVEQARRMDIPVHVILPMPLEQFRQDFEAGSPALARMERCLEEIRSDDAGSVRVSAGANQRPDCYSDAGYRILAVSDVCLFLDNGEPAAGKGGTNDMIDIARDLGRPYWIINPSDPGNPIIELDTFAQGDNPDLALLRRIRELARLPGTNKKDALKEASLFESLDHHAGHSSRRVRTAAIWSVVANGGAALVAAFAIIFYAWLEKNFGAESARILTLCELLFVLAAVIFSLWVMRPKRQDRWFFSRMAAELVRGLRFTRGILDPLLPPIPESDRVWRRFALAVSLNNRTPVEGALPALRDRYVTERIDPQISYFTHHHDRSQRSSRAIFALFQVSTWLAIPFVMLFIWAKFTMPFSEIPGTIKFLPILFPLTSGIISAVNQALEISRRSRRYAAMSDLLRKDKALLANLDMDSSIRLMVSQMEEAIVQEQLEWLSSVRTWTES